MPALTQLEEELVRQWVAYPRGLGYVLDFSDRTFSRFFAESFDIDIDLPAYRSKGSSKGNRLLAFIERADGRRAANVLRELRSRRRELLESEGMTSDSIEAHSETERIEALLSRLDSESDPVEVDAIAPFQVDRSVQTLADEIRRLVQEGRADTALDRLHTYCVWRFRQLLHDRGEAVDTGEALHALFGRYRKLVVAENEFHEVTERAMKAAIGLISAFNDARNHRSLAHANELLPPAEARLVFDQVHSVLRFIDSVEKR